MITTRPRPERSTEGRFRTREMTRVAGEGERKSFGEAPLGWSVLVGGSVYGVYLMSRGGMGVVNGAMVTSLALVFGSHAVTA